MKKTYRNSFKTSKVYNGGNSRIDVTIRIDDTCGNGHCDFAITADIYEKAKNGRWVWTSGGCQHEEILKQFPEFSDFVALHLSNIHGAPMYPEANGYHWLTTEGAKKCADYLRIDEQTALMLSGDKRYFKYQLFALGIVDKWQKEADEAIAHYERLKGEKWVNPYTPEDETFQLILTEEERREVENLIKADYYTPEAVKARAEEQERTKREQERAAIAKRYDDKVADALKEKDVYLCVFDTLGTTDNVIYYSHLNEIAFNWKSYGKEWTQEEIVDFTNNVDRSRLPEGVTIRIK